MPIMATAWDSLTAFLACHTQWQVSVGLGGVLWSGLRYGDVRLVLDDIDAPAHVFGDIRAMEAAALPILNEVDA